MHEQANSIVQKFINSDPNGVVIIRWATATGKTGLSVKLSELLPIEVISSDSRQVYKYMDIGTDKVSKTIQDHLPHHLIDIVTPDQSFTAGEWKQKTGELIPQIQSRRNIPFIVGWTWLYIDTIYKNFEMPTVAPQEEWREKKMKEEEQSPGTLFALLQAVDPEEAQKHHPNSLRYVLRALEIYEFSGRTKSDWSKQQPVQRPLLMLWLWREKDETNRLINARIKEMFKEWLVDEVQRLLDQWYSPDLQSMQGIGYKEIVWYLQGEYDLERAEELLKRNTHHLAKKQRTRFRRYIAEGKAQPKDNVTYEVFSL